jgi:signal recognition particle receptor subunit beta
MSKVTSSSGGWFGKLFSSSTTEVEGEVEEDEGLVWGGKGSFRWEDVDGVEVDWGCSALGMVSVGKEVKEVQQGNGLDEVRSFLWDL